MNATSEQIKNASPDVTKPARFVIMAEIEGFPVAIEIDGRADALCSMVNRLKAIGATPPQRRPATAAQSGLPVCPIHEKPMKASRKPGTFFCPGRNVDGSFCDQKA